MRNCFTKLDSALNTFDLSDTKAAELYEKNLKFATDKFPDLKNFHEDPLEAQVKKDMDSPMGEKVKAFM